VHTSRDAPETFKFWWDEELKSLKEESVSSDKPWKAASRPRLGLSLFSVSHANSAIVTAFTIINERRMTPTLMTFTRPYCRKMAQFFGISGAQI